MLSERLDSSRPNRRADCNAHVVESPPSWVSRSFLANFGERLANVFSGENDWVPVVASTKCKQTTPG